jgi:mono/diheme cytochrome c family protein
MKNRLSALSLLFVTWILISCGGNTYKQGERLYEAHCGNCHMEDGKGLAKLIPPLAQSNYLKDNQDLIPCILRHGQSGEVVVNGVAFNQEMPGQKYTEIQINNIINYINTAWDNNYPPVTITQTKSRLENCQK